MIRTTISKIKRVCTIAFVPRLLRGNLRYSPSIYAAFGKFEKFTSNVKSVRKSTKSGDDEPLQHPDNPLKDVISVISLSKPLDVTNNAEKGNCDVKQSVAKLEGRSNISATAPLLCCSSTCDYDKCNRVISEIFGEGPTAPQENLLMMTHISMSDYINNGKLITDRNTQIGIFGQYDSKCFKTTPHVKMESTTDDKTPSKKKDNFQSVLCYEAVLMKEKETKPGKQTRNKPVKQEDSPQLNTCLYDVDPDEYMAEWKIDTNTLKVISDARIAGKDVDAYWTDVYETTMESNTACYEPNQAIDLDTLNVYRCLKGDMDNSSDTTSKRINHTSEELERILRGSPYDIDFREATLKSTTYKQKEESLAQKIEHIDETPLVEAEKSKIEGFSVPPKVLDNSDKPADTVIAKTNNSNIDDVANRCLNVPHSQVDTALLKEIESLAIPVAGQKMSEIKIETPKNTISNKLDTKLPYNLSGLGGIKLNPSTLRAEEQYKQGLNNKAKTHEEPTPLNTMNRDICSGKIENTNSLADENRQSTFMDKTCHGRTPKPLSEKPDPYLTDDIWANDRLDPKHMLTCNETCPISPKPIINADHLTNLEGTEAMFERSVLAECMIAHKEKDNEKSQTPLQNEENKPFASREINRESLQFKDANAKEAKCLEDYIKFIQTANTELMQEPSTIHEDPIIELTHSAATEVGVCSPKMPSIIPTTYDTKIAKITAEKVLDPKPVTATAIKSTDNVSMKTAEIFPEDLMENPSNPPTLKIESEPYAAYEDLKDNPTHELTEQSDAYLVQSIHATSEKLQATSEQLQATSEQLQATSEQLEVASEKLYATSEQLQSTSAKLDFACDKINLRNVKRTYSDELSLKNIEGSEPLVDHPLVDNPSDPSVEPLKPKVKPPIESPAEPSDIPVVATRLKSQNIVLVKNADTDNSHVQKLGNAGASLTTTLPVAGKTPLSLTEVKDNIKLSELMKLVKERNQMSTQHLLTKPVEAKKSVPPMQQPRHKLPVFKTPAYPKLKPKPRVCAPQKKPSPKKTNCSRCDIEALGLDHNLGPRFNTEETPDIYHPGAQSVAITNDALPQANLTEEIILQLQNMGYILESAYQRGKASLESAVLAKTRYQFRTKNYEPWIPIPSWPLPKKDKRKKLQCPSEGCPPPPPRLVHDPHCGLKPCSTFPTYPKRTFSVLDYCTVSLGDPTFVDIGEF